MTAVIFDLDGTLIDSMGIWEDVDKKFLGSRGIEIPIGLFDSIPQGNSYTGMAAYFKERFNLPESIEEIMQEWTDSVYSHYCCSIALKPGAVEVLEFLKRKNIPLAIGTSNSLELAEAVLKRNQIYSYFSFIQTGCSGIKGKPYPDIYIAASTGLGIDPSEIIVIEDTIAGIRAGNNAEMFTIGIHDKWAEKEHEAMKREADRFFQNHFELLQFFQLLF
ncbi:MAG: HAD family phosphatase [Candidatus Cloacimonetes bacterium]|nr:HAD family phosphatase [Candidatus Cloacimonadota bacterium]